MNGKRWGLTTGGLGYATTSVADKLRLAAQPSRWLEVQHLKAGDLTGPVIDRFLVVRRRDYTKLYSAQALSPILGYLRRSTRRHHLRCRHFRRPHPRRY
jgi:hypothetical protein